MNYIIVNSVKGGCGKSSVSLKTAMELARETNEDKTEYINNVLVIDMDILGSSLRTFVTGTINPNLNMGKPSEFEEHNASSATALKIGQIERSSENSSWLVQAPSVDSVKESDKDPICFTDLFYKKYEDFKSKKIEIPFWVCPYSKDKKNGPIIHIAFSSENQNVKNRFRVQTSNNYTLNVNIRYYEEILRKYLKYLKDKVLSNGRPATHIIFDMPPNSDPYSDCVFSILLKNLNDKDSVELRIVSSCDLAHISANFLWIQNMYAKTGWQYMFPNKITYIINDVTGVVNNSFASEKDDAFKIAILQKVKTASEAPILVTTKQSILWNEKDDLLTVSSACQSCIAFSNKCFEDGMQFLGAGSSGSITSDSSDDDNESSSETGKKDAKVSDTTTETGSTESEENKNSGSVKDSSLPTETNSN